MLTGLSPARRRLVVAVLALVTAAVVALGVLLATRATEVGGPGPAARPGPVLLVPGYGGGTTSLQTLADRLEQAGRDATVVPLPGDGTGDLAEAAAALEEAARAALERTGEDTVDVVGYSAGGVIARLWVADGGAGVARRVVTLGSPHHGTGLADLAGQLAPDSCPEGCRQLATDSPVLARLNAGDETPDGVGWVSVWTTLDRTVTPPDSARLDGALNLTVQSVCADSRVGHGQLPGDPLVQAIVLEQLTAGEPVPLGAADCGRLSG
ncbi:lipase family alpha/beta hydrolase [Blastococcus saxobsidens]|uniref:Triacylglycerol esterase/lipase EstA (Alpha/beta hydrolase family) n=1 Tax=Blastococcus saxobsidens TaxID=138336 RepID=A0A4Q7Y5Y8_9ACTN|nr:alpha/beta fold hydrolase [Blastococcus saxobsidens]RZU31329.1 triacylglycerol esterase/lipase EstA (alpha/beta hydrolase family) [Blastococcus saxobsidens]